MIQKCFPMVKLAQLTNFSTFVTDIGLCLLNSHIYNDIFTMVIYFYGQLSCKKSYVIACNKSKGGKYNKFDLVEVYSIF